MNNLDQLACEFDVILKKYLPSKKSPEIIYESVFYSLFAGGKRIRPILLLQSCSLACGDLNFAQPLAAAIEMIHTYSLIHDDLPCMDNDDYRRGKLTNHKMFSYPVAVLAGDALLNMAYETIMNGYFGVKDKDSYMKAAFVIAKAAGIDGMIAGQTADITLEGAEPDKKAVDFIHKHKTSALIEASIHAGMLSGKLDVEQQLHLLEYASCIGMMFQIVDDILDVVGDEGVMGKDTGKDDNKMSYPRAYGLDESYAKVEYLKNKSIESLKIFGSKADFFKNLTLFLSERNK